MAKPRRAKKSPALGRPVPSCTARLLISFGKGRDLPRSTLHRDIDTRQATDAVLAAAAEYFPGYTATPTRGVFGGRGEPGLAIDLYRTQYSPGPNACRDLAGDARCLASALRTVLRQHSVLLVSYDPSRKKSPLVADLVTKGSAPKCDRKKFEAAKAAALRAARGTV